MRKIIAILTTILIVLNIYSPYSNATSTSADEATEKGISKNATEAHLNEGTGYIPIKEGGTVERREEEIDASADNNNYAVISAILWVLTIFPHIAHWIMTGIVLHWQPNTAEGDSLYTIQDLLSGEYYLFDINFFDSSNTEDPNADTVNTIKQNVATWYMIVRNIALVGCVLIIIYIGIRLAIELASKDASPKYLVRYKKMLTSWVIGLVLIFASTYIIRFEFFINDLIIDFINEILPGGSTGISVNMEQNILSDVFDNILGQRGINKLVYVVLYWMVVYYELKFFLMYARRSLETFFLMIISPLVCMIYPIDFVGDGRSQSYSVWLKAITGNVFMQSVHLIIFIIFIVTASEIATRAPIVAIAFFAALSNGEKIIKQLFGFNSAKLRDIKIQRLKH